MDKTDKVFDGAIPEIYDSHLVPLIFESYAQGLSDLVAMAQPGSVLETAAGSGVVTRALAPKLAPDARYVVTDLNGAMLERARAMQPEDARLSWREADALDLPFADGEFDVVFCQFGAMFFPDRAAGYREARRVLHRSGTLIFNVWDRIEENEFADWVTRATTGLFPDDPPVFLARTPHGYHDRDQIERDLHEAGFRDITIETITDVSRAPSARHAAFAYCQGTPLRNEIESRDPKSLERVTDHATALLAEHFGEEEAAGRIQAHVVVARA